jgi:membrane associated rhomboid family serine protease
MCAEIGCLVARVLTLLPFMVATLLALLCLSGVALYFMTVEERKQVARAAGTVVGHAVRGATQGSASGEPFHDFLRARTAWTVVTPSLIALSTLTFMFMLVGSGGLTDQEALVRWGANFAPRTTNGEWWRLITGAFVHARILHLLATMVALVPLGLVLERAVGPIAFASTYVAAGVAASVVSLWTTSPMNVSAGASGAICGIYGLLVASVVWAIVGRAEMLVPVITVRRIGAAAAVFFLYNLLTDHLSTASEFAGLITGFAGGLVAARGVNREKPPVRRAVLAMAAPMLIAMVCAVPLRGIVDARPEIARIAAIEERTAGAYDAAVAEFRQRRVTSEALVQLIDRTIVPELQEARARLNALTGVPSEQAPLVAAAQKYFDLREQSWRRRAEGLLRSNPDILQDAEQTERAALDAFDKMRPAS